MKITITVPRSSPSVEPELLLKFVMEKCSEMPDPNHTEPPPIWIALALSAVADDQQSFGRLKELITSSSGAVDKIFKMSQDLFMPALGRLQDGQSPDDADEEGEYPLPDERSCRQVLRYALRESRKMLTEKDFEFVRVVEFLMKAGLLCYSFRLAQFEAVCQSFQGDAENLVRQGIEIIRATCNPRNAN